MNQVPARITCPRCGSSIPADAPGELCPKCLMEFVAFGTGTQGLSSSTEGITPDIDAVRAAFPQLEIIELVGRGGMGAVYKARQPKLDRLVALKILPASLARESTFAERFQREGRLLARLNHPNIVGVFDFGQQADLYYLVMEYVDGVNLRQAYATARFTQQQSLSIIPKICEALQFAHDEGVLHRDIKPENILLDTKGRVKIADFGIAKFAGVDEKTGLTATGATIGTPHYMAPEQIEQPANVDHRADIYSLGVVFYEMLTGELPLGRFASPSERSTVDSRIDQVVLRALEKDRERRQQSADEVRTQVQSLSSPFVANLNTASSSAATAKSPACQEPPITLSGRVWRLRAITALLFVLTSILLPLFAFFEPRPINHNNFFDFAMMIGVFALWLGLPGTVLGWNHLSNIRRSGDRRGLLTAIPAATIWPILMIALVSTSALIPIYITYFGGNNSNILETVVLMLFLAAAMLAAYYVVKVTWRWTTSGTKDPAFAMRYRANIWSFTPAFLASVVVWCFLGLGALVQMEKWTVGKASTVVYLDVTPPLFDVEIVSATTIENVLILRLKSEEFRQFCFRIDYTGPSLTPQASNLATQSFDGVCFFPGEPGITFQPDDSQSSIEIAFAMTSPDAALACKNKIVRLGKKAISTQNQPLSLFDITAYGQYVAYLVPGIRPSSPFAPRVSGNGVEETQKNGLQIAIVERTIRLAYLIPDGTDRYNILKPLELLEQEIELEALEILMNQIPRGTLVKVIANKGSDRELVERVNTVIDRWRGSEAKPHAVGNDSFLE